MPCKEWTSDDCFMRVVITLRSPNRFVYPLTASVEQDLNLLGTKVISLLMLPSPIKKKRVSYKCLACRTQHHISGVSTSSPFLF